MSGTWLVFPVIFHWIGMVPAPGERLAGPQHHVHAGAGNTVAVPVGFPFEDVDGCLPLIVGALVGVQDALGVRAL